MPYPPGFPVLVPGQVINEEIMAFMQALDTREIHGYSSELGFRVFTEAALQSPTSVPEAQTETSVEASQTSETERAALSPFCRWAKGPTARSGS